ncbi:MAG: hypothetical protein EHM30_10020 [Desulfobacteraceae bacterium]|nr:MAG: hypothetical protein EHM30_10020 [Desulfobacteraceae bacterium]
MTVSVRDKLLEVREHDKEGYSPLVDYESWRVAVLNFSNDLLPQNIKAMQRHNETDEVFVLLNGRCILFIGDGDKEPIDIYAENMEPFKIYNVKKSVWHTHTLSRDAKVLIVENRNTTYENSPFCTLSAARQKIISDIAFELWSEQDL